MEIEGSEDFVSKQIENLKDIFLKAATTTPKQSPPHPAAQPSAGKPLVVLPTVDRDAKKYENVISLDGGAVKVLKEIPGSKNREKTANAALLYLFGKHLLGSEDSSTKEIREVCKDHGFLDEANFSSHLKAQKEWINVLGSGKSQTAKLTVPGKREAQALANRLNGE